MSVTGDYTCHHQWAAHSEGTVEVWLLTSSHNCLHSPPLFLMSYIAVQLLQKFSPCKASFVYHFLCQVSWEYPSCLCKGAVPPWKLCFAYLSLLNSYNSFHSHTYALSLQSGSEALRAKNMISFRGKKSIPYALTLLCSSYIKAFSNFDCEDHGQ